MDCIYSPSDENASDSDLETGVPSPDGSDDEQIKTSADLGLIVPNFCNKLREQTKPLLSLNFGVPSFSKHLRENLSDKSKESKAKKRLFKGKQQPSSGVIERRYGYIPNPRWPKSFSYNRPYEPVGVSDKDREGIPGVVFREKQNSRSESFGRNMSEHSYQESDFPMLNNSTSDRSLKYDSSLSMPHSSQLEDRSNTSSVIYQNEPHSIDAAVPLGMHMLSTVIDNHCPPSTSTPIKQGTIIYTSTPSPQVDSIESSAYTSDSADSTHSSIKSCVVSDNVHNVPRSRLKKLCPVSSADRSSNSFHTLDSDDSPRLGNSKQDILLFPGMLNRNSTSSDKMKLESGNVHEKNNFPPMRMLSSAPDVVSPTARQIISPVTPDIIKPVAVASNSTWPQISRVSPGQKDQIISPGHFISNQLNSNTDKSAPPSRHLSTPTGVVNFSTEQPDQWELEKSQKEKNIRSRNRRFKTLDNFSNCEGNNKKPATTLNTGQSQNKVTNYNRNSNRNNGSAPRTLTLESFITPQKNPRKKNGASNNKNDFDLFKSRFVEQLSANPISPPKKVRPSPIKKLSFSKHEEGVMLEQAQEMSDSGESKQLNMLNNDVKELQNLKDVIESKPNEHGDGSSRMVVTVQGRQKSTIQEKEYQVHATKEKCAPVLSLEKSFKSKEKQKRKEVFEENDGTDDESTNNGDNDDAKIFWMPKSVYRKQTDQTSDSRLNGLCELSEDDGDENELAKITASHIPERKQQMLDTKNDMQNMSPSNVTHKLILRKYARRYCHYIEEHQVPNISVELYFIIQLLTCTDVDMDMLSIIDKNGRETYFRSVHNGVYFAVIVIKRLRRLFLALDKMYLELLAACPRIEVFSPKLHKFFVQAVADRSQATAIPSQVEHLSFKPHEDGTMSFPEANNAHVFKCQRDNFYAFYRHYHDTSSAYEFRIEHQIQYIYDGCTPEQNSVVNLMHLAKLYLDHMILCCVKQSEEKVDVLKMIQSKDHDEKLFTALYDAFMETSSSSSACPLPGFSEKQMFFKDFIETMSCPSFNEHLRNLVVFRILELNAADFSSVMNLHSAVTVEDNKTPLRAGKFTETVKTLCVLGKLLGYLTFSAYTSGTQNIPHDQAAVLLTMREMSPVPVPFLLLLKQAFNYGHLCLTVPWMVEYLAMMDQMAPHLSIYKALLRRLHFIQRYAWTSLYKVGHHYSGLLIVSSISWLFEVPAVPGGFFFTYNDTEENLMQTSCSHSFQIDQQKLVCQQLLSWCCPCLEQGHFLLTLFLLKQQSVTTERNILPVLQSECSRKDTPNAKSRAEVAEIEKWLGTSVGHANEHSENKRCRSIIDDEVVPAYVLTRLLVVKDTDDLEDLEVHLLQNSPFLKASIDTTVDLVCAKITDFTHKMILKLLVFKTKTEVRMMFQGTSTGIESDTTKDKIMAHVNLTANRYSEIAQENFCALCERSFGKELSDLLLFLTSNTEKNVRLSAIHIAKMLIIRRLQEWADVQLGPALFRRIIIREAEKCAKITPKSLPLYPNDYSKKLEELPCPDLNPGFTEHEQLSELIDKALSYGVWYINALSPGLRPDDKHMVQLIEDFTNCVNKKMITMDFAFSVMANFLMHLIIQYIVDAPQNWTQQAEDAFIKLCSLCKERNLESYKTSIKMSDLMKKKKDLKVKVLNLLSVYSVQWLTKTENQLETLMAYCKLLYRLVIAQLLSVESVYKKLTHSRENGNLDADAKIIVNKVLVKVLEMLYENEEAQIKTCSPCRILTLVESLTKPLQTILNTEWDNVLCDLAVRVKSTFGSALNFSFQCEEH